MDETKVITNSDKFKEVFGYEVNRGLPRCFLFPCESSCCEDCKWRGFWDREYKEKKDE